MEYHQSRFAPDQTLISLINLISHQLVLVTSASSNLPLMQQFNEKSWKFNDCSCRTTLWRWWIHLPVDLAPANRNEGHNEIASSPAVLLLAGPLLRYDLASTASVIAEPRRACEGSRPHSHDRTTLCGYRLHFTGTITLKKSSFSKFLFHFKQE